MNTLFRNLRFILKRFKLSTVLNLLGLSVAFAAFMMIVMQVWCDATFNTSISDAENIYMVYSKDKDGVDFTYISYPWAETIASMSNPEAQYVLYGDYGNNARTFYVEGNYIKEDNIGVSANFPEFFGFRMIAGGENCLEQENAVIVPESFALRYFGTVDVVGKTVDRAGEIFISGVYKDFPANCFISNILYSKIFISNDPMKNWGYNSFTMFIRAGNSLAEIERGTNLHLQQLNQKAGKQAFRTSFEFAGITELRYLEGVEGSPVAPVSTSMQLMLVSIAIAIILIASINYVNFANSLIPVRLQSINTQKILGATVRSLRGAIITESLLICLVSFFAALGLLALFAESPIAKLTEAGTAPAENMPAVALSFAVVIAVALIAGAIPAIRTTSYSPAVALKGNFGLSPAGKSIRTFVIGVQFFTSAALMIAALFMLLQRNYLTRSADYGFAKDELIVCDIGYPAQMPEDKNTVAEAVRRLPYVCSAALSWSTLGESDNTQGWVFQDINGDNVDPRTLFAEHDYLKTMGIELIEGRDISPRDTNVIIVNQLTRDKFPETVDVGRKLKFGDWYEVIGICENSKFSSLRSEAEPVLIVKMKDYPCSVLNVRVDAGTNMFDAMSGIREVLNSFDPEYAFELRFYDQILDETYQKESKLSSQITIFSLLAVFISIIGVFGLVMFDSQYRRREIAVRKVFGATTGGILKMFNKRYLLILAVSFVFAAVVAWIVVGRWLENFAYRISLNPLVCLAVFAALAAITAVTVSCQCLRIARSNPVESLRNE